MGSTAAGQATQTRSNPVVRRGRRRGNDRLGNAVIRTAWDGSGGRAAPWRSARVLPGCADRAAPGRSAPTATPPPRALPCRTAAQAADRRWRQRPWSEPIQHHQGTRPQRFTRIDFRPCDPPSRKPPPAGRERLITVVSTSN